MDTEAVGLRVEPTENDFHYWSSAPSLSTEIRHLIHAAELVLIPDEGFRDYPGPVFPVGTEAFFQFLRDKRGPDAVEIAVDDPDYKEVAIHFNVLRLATILVKKAGLDLAVGLAVDYLKRKLGRDFATSEVRASIIVDEGNGDKRKAVRIFYEGPAPTFEKTLKNAISKLCDTSEHSKGIPADGADSGPNSSLS